jgi:hypothetical protein
MKRAVALALAGMAALSVATTPVAFAAAADTSVDETQTTVSGGDLKFGPAPDVPDLGVTLNGRAQTVTAKMPDWSAVDATGAGAGWHVSVQGDTGDGKSPVFAEYDTAGPGYVSNGKTLAAESLGLSSAGASFSAQGGTTGTAPTHQCTTVCSLDSGSPVTIASAAIDAGMGTYQAGGYADDSVSLSVPTTTKVLGGNKVYRVDLTWTLSTGP